MFTVLDLKDGFCQIKLDEKSSQLCYMSYPFDTYCFKRMPNGVKVAPSEFQRRNQKIFGRIKGVMVFYDDVLVFGENEQDHDRALREVLEAARLNGIRFNPSKL